MLIIFTFNINSAIIMIVCWSNFWVWHFLRIMLTLSCNKHIIIIIACMFVYVLVHYWYSLCCFFIGRQITFKKFFRETVQGEIRNRVEYMEWDINWHVSTTTDDTLSRTTHVVVYFMWYSISYPVLYSIAFRIPPLTISQLFHSSLISQQVGKYQRTWLQV